MGTGQSKEKINRILKESVTNPNLKEQKYSKIDYYYNQNESMEDVENNIKIAKEENSQNNGEDDDDDDSFIFDDEYDQYGENYPDIIKTSSDVNKTNKFPYNTIGIIISHFPGEKEPSQSTCFLIDKNVVVTLASNIYNKNKGGRAESIMTTFSKNKIILDNTHIYIQGEEDKKNKNDKNLKGINLNITSKLAIILYDEIIGNEWIGVEGGKKEDFSGRDIYAVFSLRLKNQTASTTNGDNTSESKIKEESKQHLREILIKGYNPFLVANESKSEEEKALIKCSPGSPLYYKDYNSGAYVIAIINENLEFQYFDKQTMKFLIDGDNKGYLLRKKNNQENDEDNIISLDFQGQKFGPSDIKYLTDFDLKNLRILNLSNNSIKATGAFYLSKSKFTYLEVLNLNFNKIRDDGLKYIANGFFSKLNNLHLIHNNITSKGIQYLVKADFINNLIILLLSENPNIGDTGVKYMKEHKGWARLTVLELYNTGLTDAAVKYLSEAWMPKLKKLNIEGNKFSDNGKVSINALRMNHIQVSYRTEFEKRKQNKK